MSDLSQCKAGDIVVLHDRNHKPRRVAISRVGRINVYVGEGRGREQAFARDDGYIKDNYGGAWLLTIEEHEAEKRSNVARERLSDFGIEVHRVAKARVLAIAEALGPLMAQWDVGGVKS